MEELTREATPFSKRGKGCASSPLATSSQKMSPASTSDSDTVKTSPSIESTSASALHSRNSSSSHTLYGEKLEGFDLDAVCACCGKNAVWAAVECSVDDCCCESADWELCEECCEQLLHNQCVTKQMVDDDPTKATAKADPSYPQHDQEPQVWNWYGSEHQGSPEYQACEPDPSWNFAHYDEYRQDAAWSYGWTDSTVVDHVYNYIPTVAECAAHGVDLNTLCVDFLANKRCVRGAACRWVHCRA